MHEPAAIRDDLKTLLQSQSLGVLATHDHGQPCTHLMAFALGDDLKQIIVITNRATRKYANISQDPRVALMVDNREKALDDFHQAATASATGRAAECAAGEKEWLLGLYLQKHPHLASFARAPSSAVLLITVSKYDLVRRFQNVHEIWMKP